MMVLMERASRDDSGEYFFGIISFHISKILSVSFPAEDIVSIGELELVSTYETS